MSDYSARAWGSPQPLSCTTHNEEANEESSLGALRNLDSGVESDDEDEATEFKKAKKIYNKKKAEAKLTMKARMDFAEAKHKHDRATEKRYIAAREKIRDLPGLGSLAQVQNQPGVEWDPIMGEYRPASQNHRRRENTPESMQPRSEDSYAPPSNSHAPCFSPMPSNPVIIGRDLAAHSSPDNSAVGGKYRFSIPSQTYSPVRTWNDNGVRNSTERPSAEVKPKRAPSSMVASVDEGPFCAGCNNNSRFCLCPYLAEREDDSPIRSPASQKDVNVLFSSKEDEILKGMKADNKTWKEMIEVLGRSKTVLQARYKEIKDDDELSAWKAGLSDFFKDEDSSRNKQTTTTKTAPLATGAICEHCGESPWWCDCSESLKSGNSTLQKNQYQDGWGDGHSHEDTYGGCMGWGDYQNKPQSNFQRATAKTESEALSPPPSPLQSDDGWSKVPWCPACGKIYGHWDDPCPMARPKEEVKKTLRAGRDVTSNDSSRFLEDNGLRSGNRAHNIKSESVKSGGGWNNDSWQGRGWDNSSASSGIGKIERIDPTRERGWDNAAKASCYNGWDVTQENDRATDKPKQHLKGVDEAQWEWDRAYIEVLEEQLQKKDALLRAYQQRLSSQPSHMSDSRESSVSSRPSSRISTGQATSLRKEAAFLRERLASGKLSSEDRKKAIEVLHIIEGGNPEPSIITTAKDKGVSTKSTTFNVSSNGHENESATLALDLKMHDLTKTITKMKAFNKFQRMQQDTDRLARIEEKLSKSKDKTKESDRVTAFQKRTAKKVERLNKRFDELLAKDTGTSDRATRHEIEVLKANVNDMESRLVMYGDDIADLDVQVQQVHDKMKSEDTPAKEAASFAPATASPSALPPAMAGSCVHCGAWNYFFDRHGYNCCSCGVDNPLTQQGGWASVAPDDGAQFQDEGLGPKVGYSQGNVKHGGYQQQNWADNPEPANKTARKKDPMDGDPWVPPPGFIDEGCVPSDYVDSRYRDDEEWDRKCQEWKEERERNGIPGDPHYKDFPQRFAASTPSSQRSARQCQSAWSGMGGWDCNDETKGWGVRQAHHAPSDLSSGWTMPGKVATVTSSVNEDCGLVQAFSKKKRGLWGFTHPDSTSSGVDTPGSSWDRCDSDGRKSLLGVHGAGKSDLINEILNRDSQKSFKGAKGRGKSPSNDDGSVVSLFF